jgi:hypothetical protein
MSRSAPSWVCCATAAGHVPLTPLTHPPTRLFLFRSFFISFFLFRSLFIFFHHSSSHLPSFLSSHSSVLILRFAAYQNLFAFLTSLFLDLLHSTPSLSHSLPCSLFAPLSLSSLHIFVFSLIGFSLLVLVLLPPSFAHNFLPLACVRACVCACVRACVRVCVRACVCACV